MERWVALQDKYEECQKHLQKQIAINEELNEKVVEYKELNNQLEYSWG